MQLARLFSMALIATIILSGCGKDSGDAELPDGYNPEAQDTWPMSELVDHYTELAIAGEASDEQILALEEASRTGEVTFAAYRDAYTNVNYCVEDAGGQVGEVQEWNSRGIILLNAEIIPPADTDDEQFSLIYDDCYNKHLNYLMFVYSYQPASRDALMRALEQHSDALRQCLKDEGGNDIDELTTQELYGALQDQSFAPQNTGYLGNTDCLVSVGIYW